MTRKRKRRTGSHRERDRYLKWDAAARLVDAAVNLLKFFADRL